MEQHAPKTNKWSATQYPEESHGQIHYTVTDDENILKPL